MKQTLCSTKYENVFLQLNISALMYPWSLVITGGNSLSTSLYQEIFFKNLLYLLTELLGGLSLHLNHLIASCTTNYDWPFGTLPFGLFWSNFDTRDLETYPRTYSGHFWNMSIFDDSRAVWVLFRKWVVSENQSFLNEGAIVTPLSV